MTLEDSGAKVVGPFATVEAALAIIKADVGNQTLDAAILDYQLGPATCEPVARRLQSMEIPIVLHTGSLKAAQPIADECHAKILSKLSPDDLILKTLLTVINKS